MEAIACYHPLKAYRSPRGTITFSEGGDSGSEIQLPCGRCIGCRLTRTRSWATRCMHEASMHDRNSFITLTFDDAHLKASLDYADFQAFMRRLRKAMGPTRFFAAGEYGAQTLRPHWHALLFGRTFSNPQRIGERIYRSKQLEELWPYGFSSIGEVTYESAAYVASYCVKKATGPLASIRYSRLDTDTGEIFSVTPEMARMSLKPGIGFTWFKKYWQDVYQARDGVVHQGGFTTPAPRYYDKLMTELNPTLMQDKETERQLKAQARWEDNTPERLTTREQVATARYKLKRKTL